MRKTLIFGFLALALLLAACSPAKANETMEAKPTEAMLEKPTEAMMEKPTETMMEEKPTEAMMEAKPTEAMSKDGMLEAPAWFGASLTNARTGEAFTINAFKGKVVLVETMAQWCPNCKKQQGQVKLLNEQLGMPADLVIVALDIDPNEDVASLKSYAESSGFDWNYAIAPAEVSREIGKLYGDNFLNPPSTPILIIDRKGEVHPLPFGIKSAEDLMKAIEPFLKDGM
jgi:thiol-disulfide isomerase/thioredoxin